MSRLQTWKSFLKGTRLYRDTDDLAPGLKPLWTIDVDDDEKVLEWHVRVTDETEENHNRRTALYVRNRDLYAGIHYNAKGRLGVLHDPSSEWGTNRFRFPEIVVNHSFELTEQWVSKLSRFSTAVDVLPVNTDEGDRVRARAATRFTEHISELHDFERLFLRFIRDSKVGGEAYIFIDYDENVGDLAPSQKRANELGMRVPLVDPKTKEQIIGDDGEPLFIEQPQRVGEIVYRLRAVPEVLCQPKQRWSKVEWVREVEICDVDELKAEYPEKALEIEQASKARDSLNLSTGKNVESTNSVFKYTYWHKRTPQMDSGRKIVLLDNVVLHNDVNPIPDAPLPCVRLTDIDIEGELHGWSFLNNIATMQLAINKLYTLAFRNIALGSHLYWLIPANARVARDRIRNSSSVIQYHGNQKPEIAVFQTVSGEVLTMIEKLEQRMLTISRIQSTSRGELPPNVEAGVAIAQLEAQETQSSTPDIKKVNAAIEKLFKLSLSIAGDKYDKNDGRTMRILGKEGEFLVEALDASKLSSPYDVKIRKTTAFSKSHPARIQQITQLEAMRPGILSSAQIYDLLELGDTNKFYDITTAARRAAEFENEQIREGRIVEDPAPGEFHLDHWDSHMMLLQTPSFKTEATEDIREELQNHIMTTEMFLIEAAKENVALAQELLTRAYFPAFYRPDISLPEIVAALQRGETVALLGEVPEQLPAGIIPAPPGGGQPVPDDIPIEELPPGALPEDVPGEEPLEALPGAEAVPLE